MDEATLSVILKNLLSSDNAVRKPAEEEFENAKKSNGHWIIRALANLITNDIPTEIISISIPLLRRMFAKNDLTFDTLSTSDQENVKKDVVSAFTKLSSDKVMRTSISSCLAALAAKVYYINRAWDELWENLVMTIRDDNAQFGLRAASCIVFGSCASVLEPYLNKHHSVVITGLLSCLQSIDSSVRISASEAICSLVCTLPEETFSSFNIPDCILKGVEIALNAGDYESASAELNNLSDLIETEPLVLSTSSKNVLDACMQIASAPALDSEVRHSAVEVLVITCEHTRLVKKIKDLAISIVDLLFNYTLNPVIDNDWDVTEENETLELESNSDFDIGVTSIDRICCAVSGKFISAHVQQLIQQNLKSASWNNRQAALALMTYCVEGLKTSFSSHLEYVLDLVVGCTNDENKVVRFSAFQCLSQMTTDFAPNLQLKYHAKFIPSLIKGLNDPIPRVASMAISAINSTYDEADSNEEDEMYSANILLPYVEELCHTLANLFTTSPHLFIRSSILSALSSIISTEKEHMAKYVNELIPLFQSVLNSPDIVSESKEESQKYRQFKCRAIECSTILAGSVKYENFYTFADPLCQYLSSLMSENLANDDPRLPYALRGWTNMVDCMQERVLPFLPVVLPSLLNLAKMNCDIELEEANVGDSNDVPQEEGVDRMLLSIPGKGDVMVKTHTSMIEDKSMASNILCEFVRILKDKFSPYFNETFEVAKHLIGFCANSEIRVCGCDIFINLLKACASIPVEQLIPFCTSIVDIIVAAVKSERDYTLIGNYLDVLSNISEVLTVNVPVTVLNTFSKLIIEVCCESGARRLKSKKERVKSLASGEVDEEELEQIDEEIEDEEDILRNCQSSVESFLKYVPAFTTIFESEIYPICGEMVNSEDEAIISVGMAFIASYIEFSANNSSLSHLEELIGVMFKLATHASPDVLHNTFNCIRVTLLLLSSNAQLIQMKGSIDFANTATSKIHSFLTGAKARNEKFFGATNNACSAGMVIVEFYSSVVDKFAYDNLFTSIVAHLPLGEADESEAKRVHEKLVNMIMINHPLVCGNLKRAVIEKIKEADLNCIDDSVLKVLKGL